MFDTPFDRPFDHATTATLDADDDDRYVPLHDGGPLSPAEAEQIAPPGKQKRALIGLVAVLALVAAWWWLPGSAPAAAAPTPVVTTSQPLARQITEWDEFVGRFAPSRSVEVRPQVSGQIVGVHFTDGQFVRAGAPLFTIDARPYRAAMAQAQADTARAASALALSRANLSRAQRLVAEDAVAATEIDRLRAEVRSNDAALAAARAATAARRLDVEFATVRAPISGRVSDRRVDAGNLVSGGGGASATLLTKINAVDPVYFEFAGSEALLLKTKRAGLSPTAPVEIRLQDESDYRWKGHLDFTDNGLDAASGTIRARAVVLNGDGFLTPGLFGRMRLAAAGARNALLVPDSAVVTDQTRKLVMTVAKDGTVVPHPVELGPIVGGLRVIEKGIGPADRIVIQGVQMALPGSKVRPQPGRIAAQAPATATAAAPQLTRAATATFAN